jgi:acetylornithine deacetylase/succinyl-diaminopimelate desuccinylase-like protein
MSLSPTEFEEAKALLQALLRVDTSNPPGNERAAAELIQSALAQDQIQPVWLEPAPGRVNLVSRLAGDGSAPPLLLSCHLDTVPANPARWTHPPFSGEERDGFIWGRGAIDMKGFAVMALTVFRRLRRSGRQLKRDVIFAAVADEERECEFGSAFLVREHPDLVRAEYCINEVGGFSIDLHGTRCYLIQVAERGLARLRIRVPGPPGHGAKPCPDGSVARAAVVLKRLAEARLPHHWNEPSARFLEGLIRLSRPIEGAVLSALRHPGLGHFLLHHLVPPGEKRLALQSILSNTVNPTVIRAGETINVVPSEVIIEVDGRVVPGSSAAELVAETRAIIGPEPEIELIHEEAPTVFSPDTAVFAEMKRTLQELDPGAEVLPYPIFGVTDSRNYAKLGTICYGFYPLPLPPGIQFSSLFHGDDERIPVEGFGFGIEALERLVLRLAT